MTRLHLGCGERHLPGYRNIDFPPSEHAVQTVSAADEYHDLKTLSYPEGSVEEVRLHHVFEHFSRAEAVALMLIWQHWLVHDGTVRIEVPDFSRSARAVLSPFSSRRARLVAMRHIFGSQEAGWAFHHGGYTPECLRDLVSRCGLRVRKVRRAAWRGTYNVEIIAAKSGGGVPRHRWREVVVEYLSLFLVDRGESESRLLDVWLRECDEQFRKSGVC